MVVSTLFSSQIQNTAPHKLLRRNLTLTQPKPAQVAIELLSLAWSGEPFHSNQTFKRAEEGASSTVEEFLLSEKAYVNVRGILHNLAKIK